MAIVSRRKNSRFLLSFRPERSEVEEPLASAGSGGAELFTRLFRPASARESESFLHSAPLRSE